MSRESWEMERSTLPDGPDTEPSSPPSTSPSSDSVEVSVRLESSVQTQAPRTLSDPSRSLAQTARSRDPAKTLAKTARSAEHSTTPVPIQELNSHTTQQSMLKPEVTMAGVPHSRRFLSIENELDQTNAALRLLEKSLISAQKEARIAWILATAALLAAALAIAL